MLYSSLFDTGAKGTRETVVGRSLLQILALSNRGPVLTALHAVNSSLILDSAKDGAFRALVSRGRISFRARHDGGGPRELLDAMLADPNYEYLGAWPELVDRNEVRRATSALLRKKTTSTGLASVDERVERALSLFDSIDLAVARFGALPKEMPYTTSFRAVFEQRVQNALRGIDEQVEALLFELARENVPHGSRTDVYREIRKRSADERTEAAAISFVDAISNAFGAESLRLPLHTAYQSSVVSFAHAEPVASGSIIELPPDDVGTLSKLHFTWKDIALVTSGATGPVLGSGETELAIERLADIYGKGSTYVAAAVDGAADEAFAITVEQVKEAIKCPPVMTAAGGALGGEALSHFAFVGHLAVVVGGILGAVVGESIKKGIEARRIHAARKTLMSFVDRVP